MKKDVAAVLEAYRRLGSGAAAARALGISQPEVSRIMRSVGIFVGKGANRRLYHLPDDEIVRRYLAGETTTEIAPDYGVDPEIIRLRLARLGVPRRNKGFRTRERNPSWRGGLSFADPPTRTQARTDARVLASLCLGRPLTKAEVIHHIDEVPENNVIANLMLFPDQASHLRYHRRLERLPLQDRAAVAIRLALESGGLRLPPLPARIPFQLYKDLQSLYEKRWKSFVRRTMKRHGLLAILEPEPR